MSWQVTVPATSSISDWRQVTITPLADTHSPQKLRAGSCGGVVWQGSFAPKASSSTDASQSLSMPSQISALGVSKLTHCVCCDVVLQTSTPGLHWPTPASASGKPP